MFTSLQCLYSCIVHIPVEFTSRQCSHPCIVQISAMFTSLQCSHPRSVHIPAVLTSFQCSHPCSVHILAVFTSLHCSHPCSVHILAVLTSLQCSHPCSVHIFAVFTSLQFSHTWCFRPTHLLIHWKLAMIYRELGHVYIQYGVCRNARCIRQKYGECRARIQFNKYTSYAGKCNPVETAEDESVINYNAVNIKSNTHTPYLNRKVLSIDRLEF